MPDRRLLPRRASADDDWVTSTTQPQLAGPSTRRAFSSLAPGLALCTVAVLVAMTVSHLVPVLSALLIAIVLGAVVANTVSLPSSVGAGVGFAARRLLRVGVALLGLQLVLSDIAALGAGVITVVVAVVCLGIGGTLLMGRWLRIGFGHRLLIACGFSICGAAAIAAAEGVSEADEEEVATSIALVVVFGTAMIPLLPLAVQLLGMSDTAGGLWAGASIHEVAQVVAAGGAMGETALAAALVVKLARVLMLAPVLAALSWRLRRLSPDCGTGRPPLVPFFVVGFVAMVLVRSTGFVPTPVIELAHYTQTCLLAAAMFALGLGIRLSALLEIDVRPVVLALLSTLLVAGTGLGGVLLIA